jgi:hypothetical protein
MISVRCQNWPSKNGSLKRALKEGSYVKIAQAFDDIDFMRFLGPDARNGI